LKPYFGYTINTELKNKILQDILQDKKIMSIIPEFVDPNYLHITLETKVKFDPANSRYTTPEIQILAKAKIEEYFSTELQQFDKDFVYSKLSKTIDSINSSIVGNVTNFRIHKRITPVVNISNSYTGATTIKFANKLLSGSIQSTGFFYKINDDIKAVYIKDILTTNGTSSLNLYDLYTDSLLVSSLGTVDYVNGTISIASLNPAGYIENTSDIRFYAKIEELDINATKDLILIIDDGTLDTTSKRLAGLTVTVTAQ
jgi:hypothetical protein